MSDLIDIQTAISAICNACGKIDCDKMDKCEKLQLPPVNNSEIPNSSDTISRANAIEICDHAIDLLKGQFGAGALVAIKESIEELPPVQPAPSQVAKDIARIVGNEQDMRVIAQPERIKGRWIEHDDGLTACECSVCHEKYALYEEDVFGRNFCPNCGAEMEVTT